MDDARDPLKNLRNVIIAIYEQSQNLKFNTSKKLVRSHNRVSADLIEEAVADYLGELSSRKGDELLLSISLSADEKVRADGNKQRKKVRKFDILWCAKSELSNCRNVIAAFEVKTDAGFFRSEQEKETVVGNYVEDAKKFSGKTISKMGWVDAAHSGVKQTLQFTFPTDFKIGLIIVSSGNAGSKGRKSHNSILTPSVPVFTLFDGVHPNDRKSSVCPEMVEANEDEFKKLREFMRSASSQCS